MAIRPRDFGTILIKPLDFTLIQGHPHDMLENTLKWLPKFFGDKVISEKYHLDYFWKTIDDMMLEHEDVIMRLHHLWREIKEFGL